MNYAREIGKIGEQMVADFLRSRGYIITRRNFRSNYGEIDIVAESPDEIVFVEVKTRKANNFISPADAVDPVKQHKIAKTARVFLDKAYLNIGYRFDIAEVIYNIDEEGTPHFSLNYINNAFYINLDRD